MFLNFWMIVVGRFFFGVCCGVFSVAGPKMLDETVPVHLHSIFGTASNSFMSVGIMIALLLGVVLPDEVLRNEKGEDIPNYDELKKDNNWRVIYGFPYICQFLTILMFITCYREDSITFSIGSGNDEGALKLIQKVYKSSEDPDEILADLKGKSSKGASNVTLGQACCDKKYRRSTWVAFALCFFQQQTGLDGIMIYSNTIFQEMYNNKKIGFTGKQGSYLVGVISFIASVLSPIPLVYFGRKTLLFTGQMVMGISLIMVAIFQILDYSIPIIACIIIFIIGF